MPPESPPLRQWTEWRPVQWMGNHLRQLRLNTWVFLEFNQPTLLNIDRKVTDMMKYGGVSYFFWECNIWSPSYGKWLTVIFCLWELWNIWLKVCRILDSTKDNEFWQKNHWYSLVSHLCHPRYAHFGLLKYLEVSSLSLIINPPLSQESWLSQNVSYFLHEISCHFL